MAEPETILIMLNGEEKEIAAGQNIRELLLTLGWPVEAMLVEHNEVALRKRDWESVIAQPGDRIELVRVVAGG